MAKRTRNKFELWLRSLTKSKLMLVVFPMVTIVILAPPPVIRWITGNFLNGLTVAHVELNYLSISLVFNLLITIGAIIWMIVGDNKIDESALSEEILRENSSELFEVLNVASKEQLATHTKNAIRAHKTVIRFLILFYLTIALMYVAFILGLLPSPQPQAVLRDKILCVVEVILSSASAVFLLTIYYRLTYYRTSHFVSSNKIIFWGLLLGMLCLVHTAIVFGSVQWQFYNIAFHGAVGIASGVCFALLIGKLDSQMISSPTWVLMLMFLYGMFQPLFLLFGESGICNLSDRQYLNWLLYPALLLKSLMYLYFMWIINEGRIILHVIFSPIIDSKVDEDIPRLEKVLNKTIHSN